MNTAVRASGLLIVTGIALLSVFALPSVSSAQEIAAVQTRQLLPPGGTSCAPLSVLNVTPYVFKGELHSFDVTINNPSYIALLGTVGNSPIGFRYMTRDMTSNGLLRIHVDVPIELSGSGSVTLTLLAGGTVTCMSTISFGIAGLDQSANPPLLIGSGSGSVVNPNTNPAPNPVTPSVNPIKPTTDDGSTTVIGTTPTASTSIGSTLDRACDATGAVQLWLILIALFIIIAVVTAINEALLSRTSVYLPAAIILVPLVLLLGFWYLAADCRGTAWMPVLLLVIAAGGLLAAFRNHKSIASIIELPPAKPPQK